uniref:Uncharacterized protein n=1 Tax=Arundo donax TaxID=35708 RepID=A0A0A9ELA8_ARUDO
MICIQRDKMRCLYMLLPPRAYILLAPLFRVKERMKPR